MIPGSLAVMLHRGNEPIRRAYVPAWRFRDSMMTEGVPVFADLLVHTGRVVVVVSSLSPFALCVDFRPGAASLFVVRVNDLLEAA